MAKGDIVPIIERGTLLVDTGNRKVTAVFRPASTLNVTAGEGGTVSASTSPKTVMGIMRSRLRPQRLTVTGLIIGSWIIIPFPRKRALLTL